MLYPNFSATLTQVFNDAPANGVKNASALSHLIKASTSTITRHAAGERLPGPKLLGRMIKCFPEAHQNMLIRAYLLDCLPADLRGRFQPEIGAEKLEENGTDDISVIGSVLKNFRASEVADIRALLEVAARNKGVLRSVIASSQAMRGL